MSDLQTCRFCKLTNFDSIEPLVKYSVRHHAHLSCGLNKFGAGFLDSLSIPQLEQLGWKVLSQYHLLENVRERVNLAERVSAIRQWAKLHGRTWKSKLRDAWISGDYGDFEESNLLQQIRNAYGPSWLDRFKLHADGWNWTLKKEKE
jgi:hypothetical protein